MRTRHFHYHIRFGTFEQDPELGVEWDENVSPVPFTSRKAAPTMAQKITRCNETFEIVRLNAQNTCGGQT